MAMKYLLFLIALLPAQALAQNSTPLSLQKLSAQTMRRSLYLAGTKIKDQQAAGGFAPSNNLPRAIGNAKAQEGKLYLSANPDQIVALGKYQAMRLYLLNTTAKIKAFGALDSRLPLIREARDTDGEWKPIESLPTTMCGNSFHRVFLGSNQYWKFDVPLYQGDFKTKIRFRLQDGDSEIISNEFDGSINLAQFEVPKKPLE